MVDLGDGKSPSIERLLILPPTARLHGTMSMWCLGPLIQEREREKYAKTNQNTTAHRNLGTLGNLVRPSKAALGRLARCRYLPCPPPPIHDL